MPREPTGDSGSSATVFMQPLGPADVQKHDDGTKKRSRGPVSCAECRRLKLKCDRRLPCSSCTKRGCAAICPNGTLAAGPGNRYAIEPYLNCFQGMPTPRRFVLADTRHLHEKIEAMSKRIEELEDALAALQAQISHEKHPLLADELMLLKAPPPTENVAAAINDATDGMTECLGTLTLGDRTHFFGNHASVDYLLAVEAPAETPASACALPIDTFLLAGVFPMTSIRDGREKVTLKLETRLPPAVQAWQLVEKYYDDAAWFHALVSKDEFSETVFSRVYTPTGTNVMNVSPHELAILFMMLAIGCMVDMSRPPYSVEASHYYQLARVALGLDSPIDHPTIQAVVAIHLMSTFLQMCDHPNGATTCYSLLGLNAQLCNSLGLHRNDTKWKLPAPEQQKRRHIFWEVASYDAWSSLSFGRPPSFYAAHVDAKVASEPEKIMNSEGEWEVAFRYWSHTFVQQVLLKVMEQAFGVGPLAYATVLRLDRLVREHPISDVLRIVNVGQTEPGIARGLLLQRNTVFALTQRLLLFLHRGFFAQAILEQPDDPLKSKYAQSVLAAFRCAFYITASVRALYAQVPLALRYWVFWSQSFSACLVLGSIVVKAPGSGLAPPAWVELDRMYELFEQVAPQSRRIARLMPKMRRLRMRAHEAYTSFTAAEAGPPRPVITEREEQELRFLWGETRLVDFSSPGSLAGSLGASNTCPIVTADRLTSSERFVVPLERPAAAADAGSSDPTPPSQSGSTPSGSSGAVTTGSPDLFAELYSSIFPPDAQQQQPQSQAPPPPPPPPPPQPQEDPQWASSSFSHLPAGASIPAAQVPSQATEQDFGGAFNLDPAPASWNFDFADFDNMPMMDESSPDAMGGDVPSRSQLDIPWQRFLSSIGVFGAEDTPAAQQQNGHSTTATAPG